MVCDKWAPGILETSLSLLANTISTFQSHSNIDDIQINIIQKLMLMRAIEIPILSPTPGFQNLLIFAAAVPVRTKYLMNW